MIRKQDLALHLGETIRKAYGQDAELAMDLIVFLYPRAGRYVSFTLEEFCAETGRSVQEMLALHPLLLQGKEAEEVPCLGGRLESVFDYCLYRMATTRLILSGSHLNDRLERIISLHSVAVLEELKIERSAGPNRYAPTLDLEMMVTIGCLPWAV